MAAAAVLLSGGVAFHSMKRVAAEKVIPGTAQNTVICTGKIESPDSKSVYPLIGAVTKKVYVKEGDRVVSGQTLMEVVPADSGISSRPSYEEAYDAYSAYLQRSNSSSSDSSVSSLPQSGEEDSMTIKAPIGGTVEAVAAAGEGEKLTTDRPAVVIRNSSEMQVRLSVGESQAAELKTGQKAKISGIGFSSVYEGVVDSIASEAKQQVTATGQETVVEAVVKIKNPGQDMKPGFSAKVSITTSDSRNVLIVPYEAVGAGESGEEYVIRAEKGKAVRTPVKTGREFDSGFEILSGVRAGDTIILEPDSVSEGTRIIPVYRKAGDY